MECNEYSAALSSLSPPVCPPHECTCVRCAHVAQITSGGEVLSSARLRDPPSTMSACRYFLSPAPDVQEQKRSTLRCYHQGQYHTTFCASTSRWTHHKHRTPSSKATVTSMWPSSVLRAVVVLLWASPTLRAAKCVALNPTESAAKDGRCLNGKPRGEGEGLF